MDYARRRKVLLFLLGLFSVEDDDLVILESHKHLFEYIFLMTEQLPFHFEHPLLHVDYIQQGGADFLFENADNQTLEKVSRLVRATFVLIYEKFLPFWLQGMDEGSRFAHVR